MYKDFYDAEQKKKLLHLHNEIVKVINEMQNYSIVQDFKNRVFLKLFFFKKEKGFYTKLFLKNLFIVDFYNFHVV